MSTWLRQSTAADVMIGPELDSVDGNTVEGGLTITQPDIRLSKNGAAFAQKSAAQTLVHAENGWYPANLSTTDTNTPGSLLVVVHESGALQAWREFMVVPANVYDSLILGTDLLQSDLAQWLGSAPNALVSGRVDTSVGVLGNNTITSAAVATDGAAEIRSITRGTSDSGSTTTMVDAARTETDTDHWKGCLILFSGSLAGQCRLITGFNPSTDTITFTPPTTQAVSTQDYEILAAGRADLQLWQGSVANALVSGRVDGSVGAVAANTITDAAVATDMDQYAAKVWVIKEGATADHYAVAFYKNGQRVTSGVTDPEIQVIKGSDGTDLIAETALSEIGSTHRFKKDESTNQMEAGAVYFAVVSATIDGSLRSWDQQVGRDS